MTRQLQSTTTCLWLLAITLFCVASIALIQAKHLCCGDATEFQNVSSPANSTTNSRHLIRHKRWVPNNGRVCLKNKYYNEYLYAAQDNYAMDADRRRVYTWIPKDKDGQMVFQFEHIKDNEYYIKSVHFGEYLYATDNYKLEGYGDRRPGVFTWRKKQEPVGSNGRWNVYQENDAWVLFNLHTRTHLYADFHQRTDGTRRHVATLVNRAPDTYWFLEGC